MSLLYARRQARHATEQTAANQRITRLASDLEASLLQSNALAADLKNSLAVSDRRRITLTYERARTNFERGHGACERGEIGPGLLYFIESWRSAIEAGNFELAHAARASLSAWRHQAPRLLQEIPGTTDGGISAFTVRQDGTVVATIGAKNAVRLWNSTTGESIGSAMPHSVAVSAMAFSPDSKTLLTIDADRMARMWDAATGRPKGSPLALQWTVYAAVFSPDGKTVLVSTADATGLIAGRIWDATTGQPIGAPLAHRGLVYSAVFSPDGKTVLTGSADWTARLWDSATGQPIGTPLRA